MKKIHPKKKYHNLYILIGLFMLILINYSSISSATAENHSQNASIELKVSEENLTYLRDIAHDTWKSIDYLVDQDYKIPIDNSKGLNYTGIDKIGFYIVSVAAAKELGFINDSEAKGKVKSVLNVLLSNEFPTWNGNGTKYENANLSIPYAWYSFSGKRLINRPPDNNDSFDIAFMDLGNYYASLIIARNAFPELNKDISKLLNGMNWGIFYNQEKGVFYSGYNTVTKSYSKGVIADLASDSQTAVFLAIADGTAPAASWENLSRCYEEKFGYRYYKPGWSDGLFMQFLPGIFIDQRKTMMGISAKNFAKAQIAYAKKIGAPVWGWSPSSTPSSDDYIGNGELRDEVVTPHASLLALIYLPDDVIRNLKALEKRGVRDTFLGEKFAFGDSYDWSVNETSDKYLLLDQAMILLSISNFSEGTVWRLFMNDSLVKNGTSLIEDYDTKPIYFAEAEDFSTACLDCNGKVQPSQHASNCSVLGNSWGNEKASVAIYNVRLVKGIKNSTLTIRYSDQFNDINQANEIAVLVDGKRRGELFTSDTGNWSIFKWSNACYLGNLSAGDHELKLMSINGKEWNCTNIDCFKMLDVE
jgi:hypothetical protein